MMCTCTYVPTLRQPLLKDVRIPVAVVIAGVVAAVMHVMLHCASVIVTTTVPCTAVVL
jgi:Na+-translocating ferredoxin:NAD+ oxidoreductase RnfE subunit